MTDQGAPAHGLVVERSGSGTPIVLLHGIGMSKSTWHPLRDAFAAAGDRFETFAIDLPGHGDSVVT
ncbi:MAG TPA: alpha/beta fold hydrolase, partial [Ilumatobacteraceae bacterium]|nr:alpha/beta fold hydrolase [Ilumatobacteraceae bacterium]